MEIDTFTGGVVSLAANQAASEQLSNLANGTSGNLYWYLFGSGATSTAQGHTIHVFDRRPDLPGAVELCNTTDSYQNVVADTQASANQVNASTSTSNPPGLGAIMTETVSGSPELSAAVIPVPLPTDFLEV